LRYKSIFVENLFSGRVAIITGGGSGIGRCAAHEVSGLGASVAMVGRKLEKLTAVQQEIGDAGGNASIHICDIREEDQVRATVEAILKTHGRIDYLVNNAGGQFSAPMEKISAKGWDTVVRNNLTGGFIFARECYTQWMKANRSEGDHAIVNIIADMWHGMPGMGHSGAARAGMLNFTETAALEWAPIRVNAVAPGWIASSGMDNYPAEMAPLIKQLADFTPARRLGTESEVSAAIVFLLSPAAAFISGSCLRIDGAAPNAKRVWPEVGSGIASPAFNGFHLAKIPNVLKD
jgi:citronellol/citronellal dehydrogenase